MTKKEKIPEQEEPGMAAVLGKGYAHVQHGMDRVISWGLKRMQDAGEAAPTADEAEGKVARAGRKVLKFFGTMGNTYYRTYEELKRKSKD